MKNKAYQYAKAVVDKEITAPKYVIKQCENFLEIAEDKNPKYMINNSKVKANDKLLVITGTVIGCDTAIKVQIKANKHYKVKRIISMATN